MLIETLHNFLGLKYRVRVGKIAGTPPLKNPKFRVVPSPRAAPGIEVGL